MVEDLGGDIAGLLGGMRVSWQGGQHDMAWWPWHDMAFIGQCHVLTTPFLGQCNILDKAMYWAMPRYKSMSSFNKEYMSSFDRRLDKTNKQQLI